MNEKTTKQAVDALRPFAEIGTWLFARNLPDETSVVEVKGLNGSGVCLTRGDFKAAHKALMELGAVSGTSNMGSPIKIEATGIMLRSIEESLYEQNNILLVLRDQHCGSETVERREAALAVDDARNKVAAALHDLRRCATRLGI